jgi:hypothetical protein
MGTAGLTTTSTVNTWPGETVWLADEISMLVSVGVSVDVVVSLLNATSNDVSTSSKHITTNTEVLIMPLSLLTFTTER